MGGGGGPATGKKEGEGGGGHPPSIGSGMPAVSAREMQDCSRGVSDGGCFGCGGFGYVAVGRIGPEGGVPPTCPDTRVGITPLPPTTFFERAIQSRNWSGLCITNVHNN